MPTRMDQGIGSRIKDQSLKGMCVLILLQIMFYLTVLVGAVNVDFLPLTWMNNQIKTHPVLVGAVNVDFLP